MKAFEDAKYNEWRLSVEATLPELLKSNLLSKPPERTEKVLPSAIDGETGKK